MIRLFNKNCLEVFKDHIEDCSIDLTITSPPYDNLRTYEDNITQWNSDVCEAILEELFRVTKDGGIVVWVVGDSTSDFCESLSSFKQAIYAVETVGFKLLDTMIYHKSNYAPAYPNMRRYANTFEYMFCFLKGKRPNTFNPVQQDKKALGTKTRLGKYRQANGKFIIKNMLVDTGRDTKDAENVWSVCPTKSKDAGDHPAVFPEKLAEDHILTWSVKGETVLDPMMGSGTTGKMSVKNKRRFIGIESNTKYFNIAETRINNEYRRI